MRKQMPVSPRKPKPYAVQEAISDLPLSADLSSLKAQGSPLTSSQILSLQRTIGNQAVQRLHGQTQTSPKAGPSLMRLLMIRAERGTILREGANQLNDDQIDNLNNGPNTALKTEVIQPGDPEHPTLRSGSRGDRVILLQRRLNLFFADLVEDGVWGASTDVAVRDFQRKIGLPADGIVGPQTWTELERTPPGANQRDEDLVNFTADDTTSIGQGGFKAFVDKGILDADLAVMLNTMHKAGGWAQQSAHFAHTELSNGNLAGLVRYAHAAKIKNILPAKFHRQIDKTKEKIDNGVADVVDDGHHLRSYILMDGSQLDTARTDKGVRDFMMIVLAHELSHHRNRVMRKADAARSPSNPSNAALYVDPDLATRKNDTATAMSLYTDEIVSRHIAWRVRPNVSGTPNSKLLPGQLYKHCLRFAMAFDAYSDSGYMRELHRTKPEMFRKQVAVWMQHIIASGRLFHNDPKINGAIMAKIAAEFEFAEKSNFAEPGVAANGLA